MQTTSTTRPLGFFSGMRLLLMLTGLAMVVAATPHPASADQLPPETAGTNQALACEMMGGWPTVDTSSRTGNGLGRVIVSCSIKGLGGWWCVTTVASTHCAPIPMSNNQAPSRWLEGLNGQVLPVLESDSWVQIESAVTAFQADFPELTSARSADAQLQAEDAHQGKGGKHGKSGKHGKHSKHGKGRKG